MIRLNPVTSGPSAALNHPQKILGGRGFLILIALLSAFVPLSTDLYLPALPGMARYFHATVDVTNLTLILFFVFYSAGTLIWGPLSDKYGRKPVLLTGLTLYIAASLCCAVAWGIYPLIVFRALQALGGSAAGAVATALVKDVYEGRQREKVLALVQSMALLAPAVAPVLGAFLLRVTSWRGVFWTLTGIGFLSLIGCLLLDETHRQLYRGNILQALGRLGTVLKNPGFASLLILFSVANLSLMAFIASSSYIYENHFGLSAQGYSYFFALNAVGLILGPLLYLQLSKRFRRPAGRARFIIAAFTVLAVSGGAICGWGGQSPWLFAATLWPATIAGSCVRPPGTNLMLQQQQEDTGSAASLMICFGLLMGSVGMTIISLKWRDTIFALGILNVVVGLLCGILWLYLSGQPFVKQD